MGDSSILARPKALTVDPEVVFFNPLGGEANLRVSNPGNDRQAVKVRCSNNAAYKIVPSVFFLESGEAKTVNIKRITNQQPRTDKIIFAAASCGADAKDVKSVVSAAGSKAFNARVMLNMDKDRSVENMPSTEPSA